MASYQKWLSDLSNSIDDKSTVAPNKHAEALKTRSALQVRVAIANVLVPSPRTQGAIEDWLSVLTVRITGEDEGERCVRRGWISEVLGEAENNKYNNCVTLHDTYRWWKELVAKIERDEIK